MHKPAAEECMNTVDIVNHVDCFHGRIQTLGDGFLQLCRCMSELPCKMAQKWTEQQHLHIIVACTPMSVVFKGGEALGVDNSRIPRTSRCLLAHLGSRSAPLAAGCPWRSGLILEGSRATHLSISDSICRASCSLSCRVKREW